MDDSTAVYQKLLVVRCQLGERAAMAELVRAWERPLLFYVRRLMPSDQEALSVMQDVWVRVFSGVRALRDPSRLAPWLYALTRRTFLDHLRDKYTRRQLLAVNAAQVMDVPASDETERFDDAEEIHYGLSRVSIVDREVLTLYFLEDLSVDEIAEVIGVPAGTVKSRLFNARKALRYVLAKQEGK